ncbi:MAG: cell division protein FtsZ [Alistipes sp.]|nr:cell division protein FtsZ [Alistipes sp.]
MGEFDNIMDDMPEMSGIPALIMVAGVGGAGGNAVDHMWEMGINGVNLVVCNTDAKALKKSPLPESQKICLGDGLGAGNTAEEGARKTKSSLEEMRLYLESHNTKMLFIAAGMGGGTGTGASPIIARLAHEMGILTVAIVTMPPVIEGPQRMAQAQEGVEKLREYVDSLIVLSNESIIELYGTLSVEEAFNKANDIVAFAAKGISEIVMTKSNLVSVDFADVCKVIRNSGCAVMGVSAMSGDNRAVEAVDASLSSPLFGGASIAGAKNVLINFATSSSEALAINEVSRALERVQEFAAEKDEDGHIQRANIIWGTSVKPELGDKLEIIIVVTGFPSEYYSAALSPKRIATPIPPSTTILPEQPKESEVVDLPKPPTPAIKPTFTQSKPTLVAEPSRNAPTTISRSTRGYADVQHRKSVPAYITRKVEFITQISGRGKRAAGNEDDNTPETQTESTDAALKLF